VTTFSIKPINCIHHNFQLYILPSTSQTQT